MDFQDRAGLLQCCHGFRLQLVQVQVRTVYQALQGVARELRLYLRQRGGCLPAVAWCPS